MDTVPLAVTSIFKFSQVFLGAEGEYRCVFLLLNVDPAIVCPNKLPFQAFLEFISITKTFFFIWCKRLRNRHCRQSGDLSLSKSQRND